MTLKAHIHQLTSQHLTNTPFGIASAPPLITQLEAAIRPNKGGGAGGGGGRGDVINMTALALWEEIAADIAAHSLDAGLSPKPDRVETLKLWANLDGDTEWSDFLEHVTLDWCDRIAALLSPLKPWHPSRECPACETRFHGDTKAEALSVHYLGEDGHPKHPHEWRMECAACGAEWEGKTLGAIASSMSA